MKDIKELCQELKEAERTLKRFQNQNRKDDIYMALITIEDIKQDIARVKE